jgi:hypothetical protein
MAGNLPNPAMIGKSRDNHGSEGKVLTRTVHEPYGSDLLTEEAGYHTAPVPVAFHAGRVWKACEFAPGGDRSTWRTHLLSAPEDADLLNRSNRVFSDQIDSWPSWQWIEGNAVAAPGGDVVILSRANDMDNMSPWGADREMPTWGEETVAVIHASKERGRFDTWLGYENRKPRTGRGGE